MCSSSQLACLAGALACAAQGCGRLGFEFTPRGVATFDAGIHAGDGGTGLDASVGLDGSTQGPADAQVGPASDASLPLDAGLSARDASVRGDGGQVAGDGGMSPIDGGASALDAGHEADAALPAQFDCAELGPTLACADFSELPEGFTVNEHDGHLTVSGGTLKVSTTRPGGEASLITTFAPVRSGTLYARFLLRVPEGVPVESINLLALTESATAAPPVDEIDMNLLGGDGFDLFVLGTSARFISDSSAFARGRFACVELTLQVSNANGRLSLRVDGDTVLSGGPTDTALDRGIARAALGIDFTGATQAGTQFELDEFVLSRERVAACP